MTLVNTETGEIVEFDRAAAERRAERISLRLDAIADNYRAVLPMIREAIEKRDDLALGYRSPGDYVSDRFGQALAGLGIEVRRAVVGELTEAGLSTRAIAPVVGVSHMSVKRDLDAGVTAVPPAPAMPRDDVINSATKSSEVLDSAPPLQPRAPVVGIDGKTYSRPTPKPSHLKPAPDEFTDHDRAEELARNLARNLSLLYALTNPDRRAEYIATWREGIADLKPLGWDFITPGHMRELSAALLDFATEWEKTHG